MSQDFNPYRDWLGVTSSSPSPSYYELLGLQPLEADVSQINVAYQRQSAQLAPRLSGSQASVAQRLMSELAEARMTLMTPTAKRAYDQALAARGAVTPASTAGRSDRSSASDIQDLLPPAASPHAAGPTPTIVTNAGASGYRPAMPQPYQAQGYAGAYTVPQAYPVPQGQAGMVTYPASPTVPNYYAAPQAVASAQVAPLNPQPAEGMPAARRPVRRRQSSAAPVLFGAAVVVAGILAGIWFYHSGHDAVTLLDSGNSVSEANPSSQSQPPTSTVNAENDRPPPAAGATRTVTQSDVPAPDGTGGRRAPESIESMPGVDPAEAESGKPVMEKPGEGATESPVEKPLPDKPQPDPPQPDKSTPQPRREASPEEAAAVAKTLNDVRAALGRHDLTEAKDLLDEATIEATAPDTLAQVNRVEMLTSYVEMFWDAVRKTLPNLQPAETIEIDAKMMAIVEADEDHLVVRSEGRNREYAWKKIPAKIAYYLADRSLATDDPVRNLVLAAFEIVEPKGNLAHAESLLGAASAARLNAEALYAELKAARGG